MTGVEPCLAHWNTEQVSTIEYSTFCCPTEVAFGPGKLAALLGFLPVNAREVLLVKGASNRTSAPVRVLLSNEGYSPTILSCRSEPSIETVNENLALLGRKKFDAVVACGGGSAIDLGKALRLALNRCAPLRDEDFDTIHDAPINRMKVPLIVLPTTAGTGSEVTANAVLASTRRSQKVSIRGQLLRPDVAIVDPNLMSNAPKQVVLHSGLDAVCQNIEAHISRSATRFSLALTETAVPTGLAALKCVIEENDAQAWEDLAWASLASGMSLSNGGLGAAHGIAGVVGGQHNAPHGALCGRLLIPTLSMNQRAAASTPDALERIEFCLAAVRNVFTPTDPEDALSGLAGWLEEQRLPRLANWGLKKTHIKKLSETAASASSTQKNPIILNSSDLEQILLDAL